LKSFTCKFCKKEWFVKKELENEVVACPYCVKIIPVPKVIIVDSFENAILKVIIDYGIEIISDRKKFLAYLSDIGFDYRKEIKILSNACDDRIFSQFFEMTTKTPEDSKIKLQQIEKHLIDEEGIAAEWSKLLCKSFFNAIYNANEEMFEEQDEVIEEVENSITTPQTDSSLVSDAQKRILDSHQSISDLQKMYISDLQQMMHTMIGQTIKFGTYEWTILDINDDSVLLLNDNYPKTHSFHHKCEHITWKKSSLREWLNDEFIRESFAIEEMKHILDTEIITKDRWGYSFETSTDRVFLLDDEEFIKYQHLMGNEHKQCLLRIPSHKNDNDFVATCENNKVDYWGVRTDYATNIKPVLRMELNHLIDITKNK